MPSTPAAPSLRVRRHAARNHVMSMWCASVVSACFGSLRASLAIFSCRVEMGLKPCVLFICPSRSFSIRSTASLRRLPRAGSPTSPVLSVDSDASPPVAPRFVAFAWRYHRRIPYFAPSRRDAARGPGPFVTRCPRRVLTVEKTRPPRFLGDPCVYMPRSQTPADRRHLALDGACDAAFRHWNNVSSAIIFLSRLYHAACTPSVYASQPRSPSDHATLDSGWWLAFAGQDSHL
jgi:hypothetical protein